MRTGFRVVLSVVFAALISSASAAQAQDQSWGELAVSAGRLDFDLSGTGNARGLAVRATRHLSSHINLEVRGFFADYCGDQFLGECVPNQLSGSTTLFVPEAQLQYRWNMGRVSPYIGGGIGAARVKSPLHTEWDTTFSAAVGTAVYLTDRLGITGELRLRGHETRFTGTTSEITAGLVWRFPAF
jgi:opacity protein-like surface antigen